MNDQLLNCLEKAKLSAEVEILVMAAAMGDAELSDALGGTAPVRPASSPEDATPPSHFYLSDITVEGFRGIGPSTKLGFQPGCGLTLVVGRNGSGKSSFAEAAELAVTGGNQRWDGRPKAWEGGWNNVHHDGTRSIAVRLQVDGEVGFTQVASRWAAGAGLADRIHTAQKPGAAEGPLSSLGLAPALLAWRPFLSYDDLGSLLNDKPTELYDRLSVLLGLEDWVEVEDRLKAQAKRIETIVKAADAEAKSLRISLAGIDDERASHAMQALAAKPPWDLNALDALATGTSASDPDLVRLQALANLAAPDTERVTASVDRLRAAAAKVQGHAGTSASEARSLAELLESALHVQGAHPDGETCPVCGTDEVLTSTWTIEATAKIAELRAVSAEVSAADGELAQALTTARNLPSPPSIALVEPPSGVDTTNLLAAWNSWANPDLVADGTPSTAAALADHLESKVQPLAELVPAVREQAEAEREGRQDRWRPVAEKIAAWLEGAREAQAYRSQAKLLKAAADWVVAESVTVRAARFKPIADQVKTVWEQLRHDSNVSVEDLALGGSKTHRRLNLSVSVDDTAAAGLGVLSQGELHALSLALFLPRATHNESPFRFVLIDDPVQALDAARVDGLARVLQKVAKTRQVVVFTHDERLPDACRRLDVAARVLEVSRQEHSQLTIRSMAHPSERYLEDAKAIASSDPYPIEVRRRVVPGLCRQALEAVSVDLGRRKLLAKGAPFADVETQVSGLGTLFTHLAFGLFGDSGHKEVYLRLETLAPKLNPVDLVKQLNKGTHEAVDTNPHDVVNDTAALVKVLQEKA